jgi:hypothetical protein
MDCKHYSAQCAASYIIAREIFVFYNKNYWKGSRSPETIKKLSLYRAVFSTFFEKRLGV